MTTSPDRGMSRLLEALAEALPSMSPEEKAEWDAASAMWEQRQRSRLGLDDPGAEHAT